jgi:hypothetical protein
VIHAEPEDDGLAAAKIHAAAACSAVPVSAAYYLGMTLDKFHIALRPQQVSLASLRQMVAWAVEHKPAAVAVPPAYVGHLAKPLRSAGVAVSCPIGAAGFMKSTIKAIECTSAMKDGASELEIIPLPEFVVRGDIEQLKAELLEIVRAARATRIDAMLKVHLPLAGVADIRGEAGVVDLLRAVREGACDGIVAVADASLVPLLRTHGQGLFLQLAPPGLAMANAVCPTGIDRLSVTVAAEELTAAT